jgi:radial spoke head protein 9
VPTGMSASDAARACAGGTAVQDVRGSWAVHYDAFKQVAVLRSLLFLGYSFYYDKAGNTWGGFYSGDGLKNKDLIFML